MNSKRKMLFFGMLMFWGAMFGNIAQAQSATDWLQHATAVENQPTLPAGQNVATRFFSVERKARNEAAATRFTLEMRHAPTLAAVSFRLYDSEQHLLAGDWANLKENKTYRYEAGSAALTEVADGAAIWFASEGIRVLKPTTATMSTLLAASQQTVVEETATASTLTCRFDEPAKMDGLIKARWIWRRGDKEVSDIFLTLENREQIVEYKVALLPEAGRPALEAVPVVGSLDDVWFNPTPAAPVATETAVRQMVAETKQTAAVAAHAVTPVVPANRAAAPMRLLDLGVGLKDRAINSPLPIYPLDARRFRQSGAVKVYLEVDEKGNVAKITKTEGPIWLQNAAESALRKWRFTPLLLNGKAVRVMGFVVFQFKP